MQHIKTTILLITGIIITCRGFGSSNLYLFSLVSMLTVSCLPAINREPRNWQNYIVPLLYGIVYVLFPEYLFVHITTALLCLLCGEFPIALGIVLAQVPLTFTAIFSLNSSYCSPYCVGAVFVLAYILGTTRTNPIVLRSILSLGLCANMLTCSLSWPLDIPTGQTSDKEHEIGTALTAIQGKRNISNSACLSYNHNHIGEPTEKASTIYLDHDSDNEFACGNFQQPRPWGKNLFIAPDIINLAIMEDGMYIFNLGSKLDAKTVSPVLYYLDEENSCLIGQRNGCLIFGDSDMFVNGLAPYQTHLLRLLSGTFCSTQFVYLAMTVLAILIVWCQLLGKLLLPLFSSLSALVLICANNWPQQGDIRYIGRNQKWPHTEQAHGIARALQAQNHCYLFGNQNCKVLVISSGYSANIENEKLVILEPDGTVFGDFGEITANNTPQGWVAGISDARNLCLNGQHKGCVLKINDITIIGTGTPTKLLLNEYLK